jgi:DeoR/GlpR family transcriptional regulator of sugar metabolism
MKQAERHLHIQELLTRQDFVSLDELCAQLQASKASIRRDLIELDQAGGLRRVHGGAISKSVRDEALDFKRLSASCHEEKSRIGRAAAEMVHDGETVILAGGSTVAEVALGLFDRPLQLITNSIPVAQVFWESRQTEVTLTGGYLYPRLGIQLGPICERMLRTISADVAILGIMGISESGLSDGSALVMESIRAMLHVAQRVVIVADHTKFGRNAMLHVADLSDVDLIISDTGLAPQHRAMLEEHGVAYRLV